jgi:hypothetical protein
LAQLGQIVPRECATVSWSRRILRDAAEFIIWPRFARTRLRPLSDVVDGARDGLKTVLLARNQVPERKPSNEWARKMPTLIRPSNAVTVSIIANVLASWVEHSAMPRRTVKRILGDSRILGMH